MFNKSLNCNWNRAKGRCSIVAALICLYLFLSRVEWNWIVRGTLLPLISIWRRTVRIVMHNNNFRLNSTSSADFERLTHSPNIERRWVQGISINMLDFSEKFPITCCSDSMDGMFHRSRQEIERQWRISRLTLMKLILLEKQKTNDAHFGLVDNLQPEWLI